VQLLTKAHHPLLPGHAKAHKGHRLLSELRTSATRDGGLALLIS
jgi:hypothetical protein